MQLTITGYSTALFSTWYFIEEWGICFDAGDGLISALLQKSRKIDHVFLSHADRDHLTGLLQFNQLNARPGYPIMHYPVDAASFLALERFSKQFDAQVDRTVWLPATDGDEIAIAKDLLVRPMRNGHVPVDQHIIRSLGYTVVQTRKKLKAEYTHFSGEELRQLGERIGRENLSHELRENLLAYSGDTPVEDGAKWDNTRILMHEATFLGHGEGVRTRDYGRTERSEGPGREGARNVPERREGNEQGKARNEALTKFPTKAHSTLDEVMEMVASIQVGQLILGHFSSRYSPEEIDSAIRDRCAKYAISFPVYRVLPGETVFDILGGEPLNR